MLYLWRSAHFTNRLSYVSLLTSEKIFEGHACIILLRRYYGFYDGVTGYNDKAMASMMILALAPSAQRYSFHENDHAFKNKFHE